MAAEGKAGSVKDVTDMLHCCLCNNEVEQPLLLSCLHSCCDGCADNVVAAASASGSSIVVCPVCNEATDVGTKFYNAFIQSRVLFLQMVKGQAACAFCRDADDGQAGDQKAELWCPDCKKLLCSDCSPVHKRILKHHSVLRMADMSSRGKLPLLDAVTCPRHSMQSQDFVCTDCQMMGCHVCAKACMQASHSVLAVGVLTEQYVTKVKENIDTLARQLESKAATFQGYDCLVDDLEAARRATMEELKANKRHLLDVFDVVFIEAEVTANNMYDDLSGRASVVGQKAKELRATVDSALKYSKLVLEEPGVGVLLQQHKLLLSRLSKLASSVQEMSNPAAASGIVRLQRVLPSRLDDTLRDWLGRPVLRPDFSCDKDWKTATRNVDLMSFGASGCGVSKSLDEKCVYKELSSIKRRFDLRFKCLDLAFNNNWDSLLLAAGADGLQEIFLSGEKGTGWKPAETNGAPQCVVSVDTLPDDSAVLSLDDCSCVILDRKTDNVWRLLRSIKALETPFFSLSVNGHLAAAAERTPKTGNQGSVFIVVSLYGSSVHLRQSIAGSIDRLSVTRDVVVIASRDENRVKSGEYACALDGYAFSGSRLWSIEHQHRAVFDMWAAHNGKVIYLLVETDTFEIMAIDRQRGQQLAQLTLSSQLSKNLSPMKMCSRFSSSSSFGNFSRLAEATSVRERSFAFLDWNSQTVLFCVEPLNDLELLHC